MNPWNQFKRAAGRRIRSWRVSFAKRRHKRRLPPPTAAEAQRIGELRETFRSFEEPPVPGASAAEAAWKANARRLGEKVFSDDPRRFLNWEVITETMFVSNEAYVDVEFHKLRQSKEWKSRWEKAIAETSVGCPAPFYLCPASSGNLIHQAYHLLTFEEKTGADVRRYDLVVEFGGGYGSMCRLFFNQSFEGRYLLFDLPPFQALQQYFLRSLNLPVQDLETFRHKKPAILCTSRIDDLREMTESGKSGLKTLFIATWSISETPLEIRDAVRKLAARFDGQLIAYQNAFQGIDNIAYFARWKDEPGVRTRFLEFPIGHLPGNYYLFGIKS